MDAGNGWMGLVSILISSLALVGVAYSLILQSCEHRMNRVHSLRMTQLELMKIGIDNPFLLMEYDKSASPEDVQHLLRDVHANMVIKYLEYGYVIGEFSANTVVGHMAYRFGDEKEREFWLKVCRAYEADAATKTKKAFVALVNKAYGQATEPSRTPSAYALWKEAAGPRAASGNGR